MLTFDAFPTGPELVGSLVRPIVENGVAVAYARQILHEGADFFEAFPRAFNYPEMSEVWSLQDVNALGGRTYFCSNACPAWSNSALDEVGGFEATQSTEDIITAAKLPHVGYKIAYCEIRW